MGTLDPNRLGGRAIGELLGRHRPNIAITKGGEVQSRLVFAMHPVGLVHDVSHLRIPMCDKYGSEKLVLDVV